MRYLFSLALAACLLTGCNTPPQVAAFNTLSVVETTADVGYNRYIALIVAGTIPATSLPAASKAYNTLHASIALAAALDQAGTNALAPANVTSELNDFSNIVLPLIAGH